MINNPSPYFLKSKIRGGVVISDARQANTGLCYFFFIIFFIAIAALPMNIHSSPCFLMWGIGMFAARFLVAKLFYKYLCPSVRISVLLSVCPSGLGGNAIFSTPS